jgi:riboflavin kinase/FMN adenylyltransferase
MTPGSMSVWRSLAAVTPAASAVAVGVFDGVHRGHQHVLRTMVAAAQGEGWRPVVVTFDPNPITVVRPDLDIPVVDSMRRRLELFEEQGVAATLVMPFDRAVAARSAEWFVEEVLATAIGARHVVVGEDFRFGRGAVGDVDLLRRLGPSLGMRTTPVTLVGDGDDRWSSTRVRRLVAAGEVAAAAAVLGHPFRVEGEVRRGDGRGRQIGYPTANVRVREGMLRPADGVYAGWLVDLATGERMPAAVSVGTNPTFDGADHRVEAFVLDAGTPDQGGPTEGAPVAGATDKPSAATGAHATGSAEHAPGPAVGPDLYGRDVAIELVERLRAMVVFTSVGDLLEQMAADVTQARARLLG